MMPPGNTSWAGIAVFILLPFPFLAIIAVFYGLYLRKRLARSLGAAQDWADRVGILETKAKADEAYLKDALASHDKLMREFHHRVKNSLQIIQSYLTLSRRQKPVPHNIYLAEAEMKVQVISTAYRLALSEGTMSPISIRTFVLEIVENVQAILGGATRKISASVEPDSLLVLDRAIPLGLAITEAIIGALAAAAVMHVGVRIQSTGSGELALTVTLDDMLATVALPLRLMAGLQSQLEARAESCAEDELLNWHFSVQAPCLIRTGNPSQ